MLHPKKMFKVGDQVRVTVGETTIEGRIVVASENGRALAITLQEPLRVSPWAYIDVEVKIEPMN